MTGGIEINLRQDLAHHTALNLKLGNVAVSRKELYIFFSANPLLCPIVRQER